MNELANSNNYYESIFVRNRFQKKGENITHQNKKIIYEIDYNYPFLVKKDNDHFKNGLNHYSNESTEETETEKKIPDESGECRKQYECVSKENENLLNQKLKELAYWDRKLNEIKTKKKEALKKKVKLHIELMKSNEGTKTLRELQKWKNQKLYEQLAILSRAQYIQDTVKRKLISNVTIHEDTIYLLLISLENLKKHIENTYQNKPMIKTNHDFFIL